MLKIKKGKKLGFFAALTMLLGSVVGVGIFFKNGSISNVTHGNGTTWLLGWIIGGLVSLFAAISFSEIGTMKTNKVHGLPAWAEKVGGKKFGYFTRFNFSFFYFGILGPVIGIFTSEMFFGILEAASVMNQPDLYVHVIIGFSIVGIAFGTQILSTKASGIVQTIATVIKFIPLIVAAVIGIALAGTHNIKPNGTSPGGHNAFSTGSFTFPGLIASLPFILFAYDSFVSVGSLSGKTEGGTNATAKIVFVGMVTVMVLYSLIALSSILHGQGTIQGLLSDTLPKSIVSELGIIMFVFMFASAYGVTNAFTAFTYAKFEQATNTNTIFGMKTLKNKLGVKKTTIIYALGSYLFWGLTFAIPAMILNSDAIVDVYSNYPTLFFFGIYGLVIILYLFKRNQINDTNKMSTLSFKIFSIFASATIFLILGFVIFGSETLDAWKDSTANSGSGLFKTPVSISKIERFSIFFVFLVIFFSAPYLNLFLSKKYENNDVYIDSFAESKIK